MEARIARLEAQLVLMEGRNTPGAVVIAGHTFASTQDTKAWLLKHANNKVGYHLMVDPHSFLALAARTVPNTTDPDLQRSNNEHTKKQYDTWEDGAIQESFKWKVPQIFGKVPANGGRMLGAISTFEKFDSKNVNYTGYRYTLKGAIEDTEKDMLALLRDEITSEGQEVARICVRDAARFSLELVTWMVTKHRDLERMSPDSPKDNWEFVSHCVRAIFEHLHNARR